jgi:DNA-binding CsgD family transcriptional regulator
VPDLIERLLALAAHDGPHADAGSLTGQRQVVLDAEVGGVKYLLVRVIPAADHDRLPLSPREREIARMVAKGYANKTIAATLDISLWTVGTYLRRVFHKLQVGTRTQMTTKLVKLGLITD